MNSPISNCQSKIDKYIDIYFFTHVYYRKIIGISIKTESTMQQRVSKYSRFTFYSGNAQINKT